MKKEIKKRPHTTTFSLLTFFFLIFSFFSCSNPLIIKILDPKTVSFETNGGSSIESQTVYRDYPVKRPANPKRSGYTFDAWYIDNGTFNQQWDFDVVPNNNMILYAKWNSGGAGNPGDEYLVTFNFNGGGATININVLDGEKIDKPDDPPTRSYTRKQGLYHHFVPEELEFSGWFRDNNTFTIEWNFDSPVTESMTLYAYWPDNFISSFDGNFFSGAIDYLNTADTSVPYILLTSNTNATAKTITAPVDLTITGINATSSIIAGNTSNPATGNLIPFPINSSLLTIDNSFTTLTLENITLQGISNGQTSLVTVTNGTLVMERGSTIKGHTNNSSSGGGGVNVNGGTLIMNGGTISNNTATYGGGVYVSSGKFNMDDGTISNNRAVLFYFSDSTSDGGGGGGVNVSNGTFEMKGGTISGNTAVFGGGVYAYGTFTMDGFEATISGNEATESGGGVYVGAEGTFRISYGIVYGGDAHHSENLKNKAMLEGTALYVSSGGKAQYPLNGWEDIITTPAANGDHYRNDTIELQ